MGGRRGQRPALEMQDGGARLAAGTRGWRHGDSGGRGAGDRNDAQDHAADRSLPDDLLFRCFRGPGERGLRRAADEQGCRLSASVFGLGGGLFFIAYVICEVPSNIAMEKVGARLWIARIMISWGIVSGLMALVVGPWSFYAVRLLLGAAEAGFFPGVILYLTYWFPSEYRGRIVAIFMVAIPLSSFLGSPISASLLQTDGLLGAARLAVAVHPGGGAGGAAGVPGPGAAAERAGPRRLAGAGGARVADREAGGGGGADEAQAAHVAVEGAVDEAGADPGAGLFGARRPPATRCRCGSRRS